MLNISGCREVLYFQLIVGSISKGIDGFLQTWIFCALTILSPTGKIDVVSQYV